MQAQAGCQASVSDLDRAKGRDGDTKLNQIYSPREFSPPTPVPHTWVTGVYQEHGNEIHALGRGIGRLSGGDVANRELSLSEFQDYFFLDAAT